MDLKPVRSPNRNSSDIANNVSKRVNHNKNVSPKQINKIAASAFEFGSNINQDFSKFPPAPVGPPPPAPKTPYKSPISPATKPNPNQQCVVNKISMRQDSSVSSDSFSQTSSPSYTTKTMETPLIPPRTPVHKQNGVLSKSQQSGDDVNGNGTIITKSVSTPASLQTIVRFHNGSNMSLHHRVSLSLIINEILIHTYIKYSLFLDNTRHKETVYSLHSTCTATFSICSSYVKRSCFNCYRWGNGSVL